MDSRPFCWKIQSAALWIHLNMLPFIYWFNYFRKMLLIIRSPHQTNSFQLKKVAWKRNFCAWVARLAWVPSIGLACNAAVELGWTPRFSYIRVALMNLVYEMCSYGTVEGAYRCNLRLWAQVMQPNQRRKKKVKKGKKVFLLKCWMLFY